MLVNRVNSCAGHPDKAVRSIRPSEQAGVPGGGRWNLTFMKHETAVFLSQLYDGHYFTFGHFFTLFPLGCPAHGRSLLS